LIQERVEQNRKRRRKRRRKEEGEETKRTRKRRAKEVETKINRRKDLGFFGQRPDKRDTVSGLGFHLQSAYSECFAIGITLHGILKAQHHPRLR
jgi:hypothetical protein